MNGVELQCYFYSTRILESLVSHFHLEIVHIKLALELAARALHGAVLACYTLWEGRVGAEIWHSPNIQYYS